MQRGNIVAAALTDVWRHTPPILEISAEELTEIAPLLLNSGAGALGWWRVQPSSLRSTPSAHELHQAYRLHTLQAAVKELEISQLFTYLRA